MSNLLFLFLLFLTSQLFAQQPIPQITGSFTKGNPYQVFTATFDMNERLSEWIFKQKDYLIGTMEQYDERGNLVEIYDFFFPTFYMHKREFRYDEKGYWATVQYKRPKGELAFRSRVETDKKGRVLNILQETATKGSLKANTHFTYNGKNLEKVEQTVPNWEGRKLVYQDYKDGHPHAMITYDSIGQLVSNTGFQYKNNKYALVNQDGKLLTDYKYNNIKLSKGIKLDGWDSGISRFNRKVLAEFEADGKTGFLDGLGNELEYKK